jgi:PAS domain S-box-containing protein
VWVLDEAVLLERDERGRPKTFHGVTLDITARKEAEAKASESESRFQMLAEQIPAIPYVRALRPDPKDRALPFTSPQVQSILGYSLEEWGSSDDFWLSVVHPEDRDRVSAELHRVEGTGEPWSIEYRMVTKDGRVVWFQDEGRLLERDDNGMPSVFQGLMLDISARKQAEGELTETEQKYRAVVEQIPAITYIELPSGEPGETRFTYISPQTRDIVGYTPEELIANPAHFTEMLHPDDRERVLGANDRSEKTGEPFDQEYRVYAKDGREVWLHSRAVLVRDSNGRPRFWHGLAMDVTARRRAEESLGELERRFGSLGAGSESDPPGSS